jgi:hypothetical protein
MPRPHKRGRVPIYRESMVAFSVRIPSTVYDTLDARAYERSTNKNALARQFIIEGLRRLREIPGPVERLQEQEPR